VARINRKQARWQAAAYPEHTGTPVADVRDHLQPGRVQQGGGQVV
jgi:hypothetical protein